MMQRARRVLQPWAYRALIWALIALLIGMVAEVSIVLYRLRADRDAARATLKDVTASSPLAHNRWIMLSPVRGQR